MRKGAAELHREWNRNGNGKFSCAYPAGSDARIRHVILRGFFAQSRIARPAMQKIASACRIALFATTLLAVPALAADTGKGDPKIGKSLVYTCGGCHGVTGYKNAYPNYHVPRIAGQNYDYIVAALTEYKKGERSHPTMRAQGESLSDEDIRNVAAYLSSLSPSK